MKTLFRRAWLQSALAFVLAGYLRFALASIRWRHEGRERAEAVWDAGGPVLVCFWHSRIPLSPACWPLGRAQEPRAVVSLSPDGEFVAKAMAQIGFPAIRGSSRKESDPTKNKRGAGAFRDILAWMKSGGGVAITPDGPRGPVEVMKEGPPMLARLSKAPVLLVGLAAQPCLRLNSWDRAVIPLPFARGVIVWDGPLFATAKDDLEALRLAWTERLRAVTRRAEAALE
jgi:lysophospholipid acyltransferase (LPLAT)-like uncharacterized protein